MIIYVFDDLFTAPQTQLLVHACNCKGVWGSGVAKEFRKRFGEEYYLYKGMCSSYQGEESYLRGQALILNRVGCLFTSIEESSNPDPEDKILEATKKALKDLLSKTTMDIAMPKINSGLFKVPWEKTEAILNEFPDRMFYVYTGVEK